MKNFFNSAIPYIIGIFLLCVTGESLYLYFDQAKASRRLVDNLVAVQKENEYFKARNGDQAVRITAQELTISEIRKTIPSVIADLKNIDVAPRQLQSIEKMASETEKQIITTVRDSIVMDTIKVSVIDYRDKWFTVQGTIQKQTASLTIASRDTVTVVSYLGRRPHPWLWIFGGRRQPQTVVTNKNPFNRIAIQKSITVKKPG